MNKRESDAKLAEAGFWGILDDGGYRVPLPETKQFPRYRWSDRLRRNGARGWLAGVSVPPYLVATPNVYEDDHVDVMLCFGSGYRANTSGNPTDPEATPDNEWIYADGDNVPEEWREPIRQAIEKVRELWPGKPIRYRPPREAHAVNE